MSTESHIDTWSCAAEATLAAAGHRRGGARRALLELLDGQACALTAHEIEEALRGERAGAGRVVSRASVYRILDELERPGGWCSAWRPARRWCATSACASTPRSITTISCATSAGW